MRHFKTMTVTAVLFAFAFVLNAEGMKCSMMKGMDMKAGSCKMMDMANCPFCVKGAEVKVVNTLDGVQITVISKDKAIIREIQEKSVKFMASCANTAAKDGKETVMASGVTESKMDGNPDDMVKCPVTGETFKKKNAYAVYEYKGKKYYMCCAMCPKPFTSNPEKYVK